MVDLPGRTWAVLGLFPDPDALLGAIVALRGRGLGRLEAFTPYPVHGLAEALGLRRSPLGGMVMVMGVVGAATALGFQYWISAVDYPIVTGAKPPDSWEAFVPILFEVTVLFATFTAGLGMLLLLNGLPRFGHPLLAARAMAAITRDRFALAVAGPGLDAEAAWAALEAAGALAVEAVPEPPGGPAFTSRFLLGSLGGIALACAAAGALTFLGVKLMPVVAPNVRMERQPRLNPQDPSAFFPDGRGMRVPVAGTVARGHLPPAPATQDEAAALVNPLPRTPEVLARGRQAYGQRCALCHGPLGDGQGSLTAAYGAKPANLQAKQFLAYPDGKIHWVIVHGKNAMPAHEADLDEDQRWAVVHYVRALQRAMNARDPDLQEALP